MSTNSRHNPARQRPVLATAWGYAQHEMLYLTWGLMDVALVTPVALTLMAWARYWPPGQVALWLLLIMLIPFNLARLMGLLEMPPDRQRTILAVSLLLMLLVSLRTLLYEPTSLFDLSWLAAFYAHVAESGDLWMRDLTIFFVTVFMWWRGTQLANRSFYVGSAGLRLRGGGLIIAPLVIWFSDRHLSWSVTPFLMLFFLAGLTAVALIRIEQIEQERSGQSAFFRPRWLSAIAAVSLLTVATAAVLAAIVSGESILSVAGWLAPLWLALHMGGAVVVTTFAYVAQPLLVLSGLFIELLAWLLAPLFRLVTLAGLQLSLERGDVDLLLPTPADVVEAAGDNTSSKLIALLLMLALVLLAALVLGHAYRQATLAAHEGELVRPGKEEAPATGGPGRLWQRLWRWRDWRTAASIRRIYRQMLQAAEGSGYPRSAAETPYEYLRTLAQVWPDHEAETRLITEAYVKVRYGETPETREEVEAIYAAWRQLESAAV